MTGKKHIDEIYNAKEPTPTDKQEHKEHNDVNHAFRAEHNREPDKAFDNPVYAGNEKKNSL